MASLITSPLLKTYTLEEFWKLPEPKDGAKLELIAGVLFLTPQPECPHDNIVSRSLQKLSAYLSQRDDKGKLYVPRAAIWTGTHTYLEPDMFYVSAELEATMKPEHRHTADLVIEVISPGSAIYDRNTKAETYGALGINELWLIDETGQTVEALYKRGKGFGKKSTFKKGQRIASKIFPDLKLAVDELFKD
ncbi:MAG: Uma2 family endonuclease [Acidobacteriota bacterium]